MQCRGGATSRSSHSFIDAVLPRCDEGGRVWRERDALDSVVVSVAGPGSHRRSRRRRPRRRPASADADGPTVRRHRVVPRPVPDAGRTQRPASSGQRDASRDPRGGLRHALARRCSRPRRHAVPSGVTEIIRPAKPSCYGLSHRCEGRRVEHDERLRHPAENAVWTGRRLQRQDVAAVRREHGLGARGHVENSRPPPSLSARTAPVPVSHTRSVPAALTVT